MLRTRVLLVLIIAIQLSQCEIRKTDEKLIQRLKRSPQYCDDYQDFHHHHHPHFGPPPPPFWPPPPPPRFWPPPPPPQVQYIIEEVPAAQASAQASAQAQANSQSGVQSVPVQPVPAQPCSTYGGSGQSSAISNAQSNTGDAVAVAVARASRT